MTNQEYTKPLSFRVNEETHLKIKNLAKEHGLKMNQMCRFLVSSGLRVQELTNCPECEHKRRKTDLK